MSCLRNIAVSAVLILLPAESDAQSIEEKARTKLTERFNQLQSKAASNITSGRFSKQSLNEGLAIYRNELDDAISDYNKSIYAFDDRFDYWDGDAAERRAVSSTLAVTHRKALAENTDGTFSVFRQPVNFCGPSDVDKVNETTGKLYTPERFFDQPRVSYCTAFKVSDTQLVTAGHCAPTQAACSDLRFISGYWQDNSSTAFSLRIDKARIFTCKQLEVAVLDKESGVDFSFIEVDRPLDGVETVSLDWNNAIRRGDRMTVVGYPSGLPAKIVRNGEITEVNSTFLRANVDTFGGNSGSPVFAHNELAKGTLTAVGVLVRGEDDFEVTSPCLISKRCGTAGCRGEDILLSSTFREFVR